MKLKLVTELNIHDTWHDFNNTDKIYNYNESTNTYYSAG